MSDLQPVELLQALVHGEVEFVLVGMLAGVVQGAFVTTRDVDVVHRRTSENVARLLEVLHDLDAVYRQDSRGLRPGESHLMGPGHQLLRTRFGDLDCLGTVDDGRSYDELLPNTVPVQLEGGATTRALSLDELIEVKRRAGRPKDRMHIQILQATLRERDR